MNEEEKKAIKELKHFISMTAFWKEKEYTSYAIDNCIGIVLHLIDKQQKEIKGRLEEIDSLYKMMSVKDDEIKYLEQKLEQYGLDYQILKNDIEEHNITYVDVPEFEEKYISKDKLKEIIEKHKKFLSNEFSKYSEDDIENRKAIQYASARLSFLLADIYKLGE